MRSAKKEGIGASASDPSDSPLDVCCSVPGNAKLAAPGFERFDAPGITNADVWESLATLPVWVDEGGSLTIGFQSSKQGKQPSNPVYSDNREGWWCATDFHLYRYTLPDYILGDVNRDGFVTIADVTALVNILLDQDSTEPYRYDHQAANVNGDDGISIADVTALVELIFGK